jgi:hypothetical protein
VLTVAAGCLLGSAPAATAAAPVDEATAALRTTSVYLAPAANRNLDIEAVRRAIGDQPIKIAIIPRIESVNDVAVLPRRMAAALPGNTIGVISGRYFYAGSEVVCAGVAGQAAADAIKGNEAALDANNTPDNPSDLTRPVSDFVAAVKAAPKCPTEADRLDRYADEAGGGTAVAGPDDTATVLPWVLGGIGLVVLVVATLVLITRRRTRGAATQHRDEAHTLVRRLGAELAELPEEGDTRAEAAAKHGEAEAILVSATTDEQFAAARQAALDGLTAARNARAALDREAGRP